jgi:hypothetical protein
MPRYDAQAGGSRCRAEESPPGQPFIDVPQILAFTETDRWHGLLLGKECPAFALPWSSSLHRIAG